MGRFVSAHQNHSLIELVIYYILGVLSASNLFEHAASLLEQSLIAKIKPLVGDGPTHQRGTRNLYISSTGRRNSKDHAPQHHGICKLSSIKCHAEGGGPVKTWLRLLLTTSRFRKDKFGGMCGAESV